MFGAARPPPPSRPVGPTYGTARLWDLATGKLVRTFIGHVSPIRSVCFSSDGKFVFTAGGNRKQPPLEGPPQKKDSKFIYEDCTIRKWEMATGKELLRIAAHPCGRQAASSSHDHSVRRWSLDELSNAQPAKDQSRPEEGRPPKP